MKRIRHSIFLLALIFPLQSYAQSQSLPLGWTLLGNDAGAAVDTFTTFGNATNPTTISSSVATVWTWSNSPGRWNFFAPSMTAQELATYASSKGYGVLSSIAKGEGFWVNAKSQFVYSPVTAMTFPLQTGYKALLASGLTKSFTISGTCTGSGNKSSSPATTPATFEGIAGFSAMSTITFSFTNCTPASTALSSTSYYDSHYVPLGMNSIGVNYGVYSTPLAIPTTVIVGNTGPLGTVTLYTSSSKATSNGSLVQSYVVEADTSTTAIVNLIAKIYNAAGTLTATEQDRYQITTTGALTPISIDIQYANGSTTHLVFTF